ncbi:ABC transporter permease [Mycoplasmopsis opalescens]|uniref:ABC transporter permease n=1 Tax=Mycoplasmopsis opalescens TaxID=114886 RepID=UPI0004A77184|nr:ABC transporter permease [Mycoplasmopsis opalescens]
MNNFYKFLVKTIIKQPKFIILYSVLLSLILILELLIGISPIFGSLSGQLSPILFVFITTLISITFFVTVLICSRVFYFIKNEGLQYIIHSKPINRNSIYWAQFLATITLSAIVTGTYFVLSFIISGTIMSLFMILKIKDIFILLAWSILGWILIIFITSSVGGAISQFISAKGFFAVLTVPVVVLQPITPFIINIVDSSKKATIHYTPIKLTSNLSEGIHDHIWENSKNEYWKSFFAGGKNEIVFLDKIYTNEKIEVKDAYKTINKNFHYLPALINPSDHFRYLIGGELIEPYKLNYLTKLDVQNNWYVTKISVKSSETALPVIKDFYVLVKNNYQVYNRANNDILINSNLVPNTNRNYDNISLLSTLYNIDKLSAREFWYLLTEANDNINLNEIIQNIRDTVKKEISTATEAEVKGAQLLESLNKKLEEELWNKFKNNIVNKIEKLNKDSKEILNFAIESKSFQDFLSKINYALESKSENNIDTEVLILKHSLTELPNKQIHNLVYFELNKKINELGGLGLINKTIGFDDNFYAFVDVEEANFRIMKHNSMNIYPWYLTITLYSGLAVLCLFIGKRKFNKKDFKN